MDVFVILVGLEFIAVLPGEASDGELADLRTKARTDRDQVRADHAAQLAEVRQSAADRVDALTTTLRAAEQTIEELRRQPGGRGAGT